MAQVVLVCQGLGVAQTDLGQYLLLARQRHPLGFLRELGGRPTGARPGDVGHQQVEQQLALGLQLRTIEMVVALDRGDVAMEEERVVLRASREDQAPRGQGDGRHVALGDPRDAQAFLDGAEGKTRVVLDPRQPLLADGGQDPSFRAQDRHRGVVAAVEAHDEGGVFSSHEGEDYPLKGPRSA